MPCYAQPTATTAREEIAVEPLPAAEASGRARGLALAALALCASLISFPAGAAAEQASQPTSAAAGSLHAGAFHTCSLVAAGRVRCWGFNANGQLGQGNTRTIGDDELPGSVEPVNLGPGAVVTAIGAGTNHTCALLEGGSVRCWGFGGDGRLGYGNTRSIGDDERPDSAGPVNLGAGRAAKAITAGDGYSCALLVDGTVHCWGYNGNGELGTGNTDTIGDNEAPAAGKPVDLGSGRTASAITAGFRHTCALLDDGRVRCWGYGGTGQLGLGDGFEGNIGDDEPVSSVEPVKLGPGRTVAISAGYRHTCAVRDDGKVRCWGYGQDGRLGYGNTANVGLYETPDAVGPVDLGPERRGVAISAGRDHTCAVLDDASVRCWGYGGDGRLGYGNQNRVGDSEAPGSVGPVNLGPGRTALAISAGLAHTCARLDDASVRCWGYGSSGRLGLCNQKSIGDDETPAFAGPVMLDAPAGGGPGCGGSATTPGGGSPTTPGGEAPGPPLDSDPGGARAQAARLRNLRGCLAKARRHLHGETRRASRLSGSQRARTRRHARRQRSRLRSRCLKRWGRTPGRVTGLNARAVSARRVELSFKAAGTDGNRSPVARSYLVKQSRRPIRGRRAFRRARTLCDGHCRFPSTTTRIGGRLTLAVADLRPRTTYYYAVAARDNVSRRLGRRSRTARTRTR